MTTTTFDDQHLIVARAQKVAGLLALAYHHNIPVPTGFQLTTYGRLPDLEFSATWDEYRAWKKWLGAVECRDYPGSGRRTATATAVLEQWGPVTVRFTVARDADE